MILHLYTYFYTTFDQYTKNQNIIFHVFKMMAVEQILMSISRKLLAVQKINK